MLRYLFRRYFLWRNRSRHHYRIDRRLYRGPFKPGFFAFLSGSRFWEATNDHFEPRRVWRKRIGRLLVLLLLVVLIYLARESIRGIQSVSG
jgi:hypothetical protein